MVVEIDAMIAVQASMLAVCVQSLVWYQYTYIGALSLLTAHLVVRLSHKWHSNQVSQQGEIYCFTCGSSCHALSIIVDEGGAGLLRVFYRRFLHQVACHLVSTCLVSSWYLIISSFASKCKLQWRIVANPRCPYCDGMQLFGEPYEGTEHCALSHQCVVMCCT